MAIKLSVVDQSPVHGTREARQAPLDTVALAKACDNWGYYRYWVAEHHNSIHFANPCPEILVARIAAETQNMRIGSGGVMLSHYSAYKVAEVFRMLATLYPNRIDLGVGRAPGGNAIASSALAGPHGPSDADHFPQQAFDLVAYLRNQLPGDHPFESLQQLPDDQPTPQIWMLGSGGGSSSTAGALGMGLAVARFIAPDRCSPAIFAAHEAALRQAGYAHKPERMLAIAAICADTEAEAKLIAGTSAYRKVMTYKGDRQAFLTPEAAQDAYRKMSISDQSLFDQTINAMACGTPEQCADEIQRLSTEFATDEIAVVAVTHSFEARLRSYELLAKAFC